MGPAEFTAAVRKGKPAPVYFLRGPDRFLHEECRRALIESVPPQAREWCLSDIEFQPGRLAKELEGADQIPMLGSRNYFFFSDPEDFSHSTDEDAEALRVYLERPSPFSTVIFAAVDPDRRRRFIQLLEKNAGLVELRPPGRREAAAWAREYLSQTGVEIEEELAEEIAAKFENTSDRDRERAGVNLLWMRTELEKLLTARPGVKTLGRADLDLITAFREEHQIGKFLLAIAGRKTAEALGHLHALLASKTAETLLLWCVGDLFRQALKLQAEKSARVRRGDAPFGQARGGWARSGGAFSNWEIAATAVEKYSQEELLQSLRLARSTDLRIKSSWKDSKILLEFLAWNITVGKGSSAGGEQVPAPAVEDSSAL